MRVMKAAIFEGVENIVARQVPIPDCKEDGILLKVEACGICGGDIRNYHNGLRAGMQHQIIGHEIVGIIDEVGKKVARFKVGDRIAVASDVSCGDCFYCRRGLVNLCVDHKMIGTHWAGGFAQYIHLSGKILDHGVIELIPDKLSFDEAVLAEPATSVIACQERVNISVGSTVVIFGDGPIGCLHCEVAKARGASLVIMIGRRKLELAKQFNGINLINSNELEPVKEVLKLTEGIGVDVCICANPNTATQQQGLEMVRKRGTVVLFGGVPERSSMTILNSNIIHYNEITVLGSFSAQSTGLYKALKMLSEGKINANKYISGTVTLDNVPEGIALAEQGKALKIIIKPWA